MTEPWGSILAGTCLAVQAVCLVALLFGAIRFRSAVFVLLALALIVWPFAGELSKLWSKDPNRSVPAAMLRGEFLTKVSAAVWSVQALLIPAVTVTCFRAMRKRRPAENAVRAPSPGASDR